MKITFMPVIRVTFIIIIRNIKSSNSKNQHEEQFKSLKLK